MRHVLRWSLGATVVLTAAALWWPPRQAAVVAAVTRGADEPAPAADASRMVDRTTSQLPADVVPLEVEPARRDPFVPVEPPPKPTPAPPPQPPSPPPVMQAPPPPAPPPAPQLRYFGSMVAPDGKRVTMLAAGDQALPVQVGMTLDSGYVVQAISANAVTLTHPPTGTRFDVAIPDPDSKSR